MQFEGTVNIQAPRDKVWKFLTDPNQVSSCAPGVETVDVVIPEKLFNAVAVVAFGSAKVKFQTDVEWLELFEPRYAKMKAHGKTPGSGVDVISEMRLMNNGGSTDLFWKADVLVVGQLASTAARLMSGVTKNVTTAFFNKVKEQIETAEAQPDTVALSEGSVQTHKVESGAVEQAEGPNPNL